MEARQDVLRGRACVQEHVADGLMAEAVRKGAKNCHGGRDVTLCTEYNRHEWVLCVTAQPRRFRAQA